MTKLQFTAKQQFSSCIIHTGTLSEIMSSETEL